MNPTTVGIRKTIRPGRSGGSVPRIPFEALATSVLGQNYELSLVVCGDGLARRMNRQYRPARPGKKAYAPNVLSFPLGKHEGEIFLNIRKAEREAREYRTTLTARLALLYVHGLYHLKGLTHGAPMEAAEQKTLEKFKLG